MASPTVGPLVGNSDNSAGVLGTSNTDDGVIGRSTSAFGVFGASVSGDGIHAVSETSVALQAQAKGNGIGVDARSIGGVGVSGISETNDGVVGISNSGVGVHGKGGKLAGFFEDDVQVTRDIVEDFDTAYRESAAPGTVMVLSEGGELRDSYQAYDKCVIGVASGAGHYKPGILLDKQHTSANRRPIALLGKVYCKVDAQFGAVESGRFADEFSYARSRNEDKRSVQGLWSSNRQRPASAQRRTSVDSNFYRARVAGPE